MEPLLEGGGVEGGWTREEKVVGRQECGEEEEWEEQGEESLHPKSAIRLPRPGVALPPGQRRLQRDQPSHILQMHLWHLAVHQSLL